MPAGDKNKKTPGLFKGSRLLQVCRLLNEQSAHYLVVGGHACNLHGLIRATKDVDLLIPKNIANTERVLEGLKGLAWGIAGELDAEEVASKPFTIIGDTPRVDLLTVANKVKYEQASSSSLEAKIEGVKVPYVDLKTLLLTKQTDRLQDRADVERLQQLGGRRKKELLSR